MMLNKIPPNTSISSVLSHLEKASKYGDRNRAMFALRQLLRIRDISVLQVSDVLGLNGVVRGHYIAQDGSICPPLGTTVTSRPSNSPKVVTFDGLLCQSSEPT